MAIENLIVEPLTIRDIKDKLLLNKAVKGDGPKLLVLNDIYLAKALDDPDFKATKPTFLNQRPAEAMLIHSNLADPKRFNALLNAYRSSEYLNKKLSNINLLIGTLQILDNLSDRRSNAGIIDALKQLRNMNDDELIKKMADVNLTKKNQPEGKALADCIVNQGDTQEHYVKKFHDVLNVLFQIHAPVINSVRKPYDILKKDGFYVLPVSTIQNSSYFKMLLDFCKQLPMSLYLDTDITNSPILSDLATSAAQATISVLPNHDSLKIANMISQAEHCYSAIQNTDQSILMNWIAVNYRSVAEKLSQWEVEDTLCHTPYSSRVGVYLSVSDKTLEQLQRKEKAQFELCFVFREADKFVPHQIDIWELHKKLLNQSQPVQNPTLQDTTEPIPNQLVTNIDQLQSSIEQINNLQQLYNGRLDDLEKTVQDTRQQAEQIFNQLRQLSDQLQSINTVSSGKADEFTDDYDFGDDGGYNDQDINRSFEQALAAQRSSRHSSSNNDNNGNGTAATDKPENLADELFN